MVSTCGPGLLFHSSVTGHRMPFGRFFHPAFEKTAFHSFPAPSRRMVLLLLSNVQHPGLRANQILSLCRSSAIASSRLQSCLKYDEQVLNFIIFGFFIPFCNYSLVLLHNEKLIMFESFNLLFMKRFIFTRFIKINF